MTRAKVVQIGLATLALGAIGYGAFRLLGLDAVDAGISAEAVLIVVVIGWTCSYLVRVVNGKMTFIEQRKRYRKAYEKLTNAELQARFDSMTDAEQTSFMQELEREKKAFNSPLD